MILASAGLSSIQKATLICDIEAVEKQIKTSDNSDFNSTVLKMYLDFEKLCFTLSDIDGKTSAPELKKWSAMDFLLHKKYIEEKLSKK